MHLQEVIIDGFKSYSQRTVVSGWDHEFNAITGLNGSGKSNILDAICFVLGISNLSQVRAASLQDLIYKQGQAGITKATVTLIFNNSDPKTSPVGQELCETIAVSRQIVMGGRNKYTINGHTVDASRVHDMFQSVGLNVNNPHFLIMQGRITKVLNMKPPEILGLIEEAAGTRMFEAKKQAAQKTIEKKQVKVEELGRVLEEEITPQLKKLQEERANYLRWAANNTELERLAKFRVAYEYTLAERSIAGSGAKLAELSAAGDALMGVAKGARARAAAAEASGAAAAARVASARGGELASLTDAASAATRDLAGATTALKHAERGLGEEEKGRAVALKQCGDAERVTGEQAGAMERFKAEGDKATAAARAGEEATRALQAKLTAVAAGMMVGDGGSSTGSGSGSGSSSTAADALMQAKSQVKALEAEGAGREMKVKALLKSKGDAEKAVKAAEKDAAGLQSALKGAQGTLEAKRGALASLKHDGAGCEALAAKRDALAGRVAGEVEGLEEAWGALAPLVEFRYEEGGMGKGWDAGRVKGTVAQLVRLVRPEAAKALEVCAGGRLYGVVVDTEDTGAALLDRGGLKKRVDILPLSQLKCNPLTEEVIALAQSIAPGKVFPALSLIRPTTPEVARALEYVFGSTFICESSEVADRVCFDKRIGRRCVTLAGDVFDPRGILEGGGESGGGKGGSGATGVLLPLLARLEACHAANDRVLALKRELGECEGVLSAASASIKAHARLTEECDMAATEVRMMSERLGASALGGCREALEGVVAQLLKEEAGKGSGESALRALKARVVELEAEVKNAVAARAARVAAVEKELAAARVAAAGAEAGARKARDSYEAAAFELEAAREEGRGASATLVEREAGVAACAKEVGVAKLAVEKANGAVAATKAALAAAKEAIAAADRDVKRAGVERDAAVAEAEEAEVGAKAKEGEKAGVKKGVAVAEKSMADLLASHAWIPGEKPYFDRPHSDYDFTRNDPAKAQARLGELERQQGDLERRINKKVMGMIDGVEREYHDLRTKKLIIANDKAKIEKVISELEEKKNEALRTTWAKVNKDFGSIFATLLPGVHSKLDLTESGNVLDGLIVRVSFNGVWKESLTELSGGQRSLLALSLILALLLFKPAPMYILDEVDAALDLSHTQNIGHMIRTYFSHSQFIVVSLKQGMFSNANVIFRTKFVEGTSTVLRTVPSGSTLLGGAAGGKRLLKEGGEREGEGEGEEEAAPAPRATKGAGGGAVKAPKGLSGTSGL